MLILGIDTSCDDTSCAVVQDGKRILSNVVSSQVDLHSKYGGVVPEIASRRHLELIVPVMQEALNVAGIGAKDLDGIAVTMGPGLLGALLVGVSYAKSLAYGLDVPLVGVHHLEGHIYSNFLEDNFPSFPLLNLVVSGGHSDLIMMKSHGSYEILGETRDDAAGEVFDKVARELGLPFPGGPHLDKLADCGDQDRFFFPRPKIQGSKYDYSFSGIKTRAVLEFEACGRGKECVADLAASFRKAVVDQLLHHIDELLKNTGARGFAISGGVAANSLLRKEAVKLCEGLRIPLFIPPKNLCTDNGAMIAAAGFYRLKAKKAHGPDLNAVADLELESWE